MTEPYFEASHDAMTGPFTLVERRGRRCPAGAARLVASPARVALLRVMELALLRDIVGALLAALIACCPRSR